MDRKYGSGKINDKCEKCGCTCGHKVTKTRKPSVRGQQIKE